VINHALQGITEGCKPCIDKLVSFLCIAPCCTVLRSRWYQDGINITFVFAQQCRPRRRRSRAPPLPRIRTIPRSGPSLTVARGDPSRVSGPALPSARWFPRSDPQSETVGWNGYYLECLCPPLLQLLLEVLHLPPAVTVHTLRSGTQIRSSSTRFSSA
jgi:hypothetical protein